MRLALSEQVRALEAYYRDRLGLPLMALMEAAGAEVARAVSPMRAAGRQAARPVIALCGKGNNGGDALVAARRLLDSGVACEAWLVGRRREQKGDAAAAAAAFHAAGGRIREQWAGRPVPSNTSVVIDGLLGSGLTRAPEGAMARAIRSINRARDRGVRVVAVDVPSGISADSGSAPGDHVVADATVTFAPLKLGLVQDNALDAVGHLIIAEIGIPTAPLPTLKGPELTSIDRAALVGRLGPRPRAGFKNTFGHVLCIGGSPGKGGSIALTALAALKTGAGLATVCSRAPEVRAAQAFGPEIMGWELPGQGPVGPGDERVLEEACQGKQAVVCGPGLFRGPRTGEVIRRLVRGSRIPWLLDADALNALGEAPELSEKVVITPHPGEAGRLLGGRRAAEVQGDRLGSATALSSRTGAVVVLKGARTLVCSANRVGVSLSGSPLLATAGSGDVLSGIGGALLARGKLPIFEAAQLAVGLHAHLADLLEGQGSAIASDLLAAIPPGAAVITRVVAAASLRRTRELGRQLGQRLQPGDFVALDGELGAGKTELVRAICESLGVPPSAVSSPTFGVIATYGGGRLPVTHVDLYRIADEDELYSTGYFDQLSGPGVMLVEWASRITGALPERRLSLTLESTGARSRKITAAAVGERHEALLSQWLEAPPSGTSGAGTRRRSR